MIDSYKRGTGGESIIYYKRRYIYIYKTTTTTTKKKTFIISLHGFVDWFGFFSSLLS